MTQDVGQPDFLKEPYKEWCDSCKDWVISLGGHCFNNDSHRTGVLTKEDRKELFGGVGRLTLPNYDSHLGKDKIPKVYKLGTPKSKGNN